MAFYLFKRFLFIGSISFGGHMALISMIRAKLVVEDKCIDDKSLSEGIAIASILPGPMAVNVVAYIGYLLQGWLGSLISMVAVLLPSFIMVLFFAYLFFEYQTTLDFSLLFTGVLPVVVAIILSTATSMAEKNCKHKYQWLIAGVSLLLSVFFASYWATIIIISCASIFGILFNYKRINIPVSKTSAKPAFRFWGVIIFILIIFIFQFIDIESIGVKLFVVFSNISLTLFGGGYIMVPMLKSLIVEQYGWLNTNEFSVGISVGQVTPGPILISAAFFGYKIYGLKGAVISTVAIFLPSSILMVFISQAFQRLRENVYLKAAFDGILPAVIGLIVYSGISLFKNHINSYPIHLAIFITLISFVLTYRFRWAPPAVIGLGFVIAFVFNSIA